MKGAGRPVEGDATFLENVATRNVCARLAWHELWVGASLGARASSRSVGLCASLAVMRCGLYGVQFIAPHRQKLIGKS